MSVELYLSDSVRVAGLPLPAHSQPVEIETQQAVYHAGGGAVHAVKFGQTLYRISRTFEGLTEQQAENLLAFWELSGQASPEIKYRYTPAGGSTKSVACRLIEPPRVTQVHRDNWDATLVFEQELFPVADSEPNQQ